MQYINGYDIDAIIQMPEERCSLNFRVITFISYFEKASL